jgi:dihydroorotase
MTRRDWLTAAAGAAVVPALGQQRYDLLVQGGEVWDPSRGFRQRASVAIAEGKIAAIEPSIDASRAREVVDAKGLMVVPGLVDLHTHVHVPTGWAIEADPLAAKSGVTTWVDAGTFAGPEMPGFRRFTVNPSQVRIYGYVYLYPMNRNPDMDPIKLVRSAMRQTGEAAAQNKDIILGVKFQVGSNMNGKWSLEFLKIARELCDKYQLPLMVHISFAPPDTDQVMELLRKGDVVTHCYNGHTLGILDANGKVRTSVREARARGVFFDVGHGAGSFNFPAARKALDDGFLADTISTDVYAVNINGPVFDMPTTMSKLLHLGLSLEEVLIRSTINPAKVVNRLPGMGTLTVGGPADIALLTVEEGSHKLIDSQRNAVSVSQRIVSKTTICKGRRLS